MMACLTRVETTGGIGTRGRRRHRQRQQNRTGRPVSVLCYVVFVHVLQNVVQLHGMSESEADQMFLQTIVRCRGASKIYEPDQLVSFSSEVLSFCLVPEISIGSVTIAAVVMVLLLQ